MRIREVEIANFKNLHDLRCDFDAASPYSVLVGENGSGKSNLLEALALIFRNLDLDEEAPFTYKIRYECRGHDIEVDATADQHPKFRVASDIDAEHADLSRTQFMACDDQNRPIYRPAFVFGYYSGPSDRLSTIFDKHQERYYSWIIKSPAQRGKRPPDPNTLRRVFYAQTLHGQFALIAFFMESGSAGQHDREFLREFLQIDALDSVLFALTRPPWTRRAGGDPRFWGAVGEVQEFLSRLYDRALLPMRMERRMSIDVAKNPAVENLYLFLPNVEALEQVYQSYGNQYAFFTALESMHLSKLLGEVRTRVRMVPSAGRAEVTYRDLSEGEQQLLLVLGLLKFTARDEALFLLDEPDTHLNPAWSTQYLQFLDHFIRERDSCQILMSSHDPLVFAGLQKNQVRILRRGDHGHAVAEVPDQDPRGMGVAAILTSDLFRLRSTLDLHTQAALDRQRALSVKTNLNPEDVEELRRLRTELTRLGFSQTSRDPLYQLFVKAWNASAEPQSTSEVQLTPEQQRARARLASHIVQQLRLAEDS